MIDGILDSLNSNIQILAQIVSFYPPSILYSDLTVELWKKWKVWVREGSVFFITSGRKGGSEDFYGVHDFQGRTEGRSVVTNIVERGGGYRN